MSAQVVRLITLESQLIGDALTSRRKHVADTKVEIPVQIIVRPSHPHAGGLIAGAADRSHLGASSAVVAVHVLAADNDPAFNSAACAVAPWAPVAAASNPICDAPETATACPKSAVIPARAVCTLTAANRSDQAAGMPVVSVKIAVA